MTARARFAVLGPPWAGVDLHKLRGGAKLIRHRVSRYRAFLVIETTPEEADRVVANLRSPDARMSGYWGRRLDRAIMAALTR